MSAAASAPTPDFTGSNDVMARMARYWPWFLALGVLWLAMGTFILGWSCLATVSVIATWVLGFFMVGYGILEIIHSFSAGRFGGRIVHVLVGVLYTVAGLMMIDSPDESALLLTKIFSLFLMIGGTFRILAVLLERFSNWGWVLLNGVVSLMLGLMIFRQWPYSGLWFIGLALGIDMMLNGWTWIMLGLGLRKAPAAE